MDKLALVIGASSESVFAIKTAKKIGYSVLAFDGDKNAEGLAYADEQYVTDIRNPQNIISILGIRKPSIVLPVPIGCLVVTSGAINDYYQLKGVCKESCELCADKYKFHNALSAKWLRDAECFLVKKGETVPAIPTKYPLVVKPRYGSGSRCVYVVNTKEDFLSEFVENLPYDEDFLVETLIEGEEYGVDGAVIDGILHIVLLRKKIITPLPARQCIGYYSVVPSKQNQDLFQKIQEHFEAITTELQMDNCLFHADLILNDNSPFLIEISPRSAGHYLSSDFTVLATGVDMLEEYILYASSAQQPYSFTPKYTKKLLIKYFDFENCRILKIPDAQKMLKKYPLLKYQCNIENAHNAHLGNVCDGHSIMSRGFFILEADDEPALDKYAQQILNEFEVEKDG